MESKPRDRDMKSPVARLVKGNEFKMKRRSIMNCWNVYTRLHEIAEAEGLEFNVIAERILDAQKTILTALRQRSATIVRM